MGKYQDGILGTIRGKVGPVVGSIWRGIPYFRSKGPDTNNSNTQGQKEQRARFAIAVKFATRLAPLFAITFRSYANKMTARNSAISSIMETGVVGAYPAYELDYDNILVSRGTLEQVLTPSAAVAAGRITWTWTSNAGVGNAKATDRAILVAYCEARKQCIYALYVGTRAGQSAALDVNPFVGQTAQTWLCFISEDGQLISNSVSTGQLTIV